MDAKREVLGLAMTLPRYFLAEEMARRVEHGKSIVAPMLMFVGADLADGAIMRHTGGARRRHSGVYWMVLLIMRLKHV